MMSTLLKEKLKPKREWTVWKGRTQCAQLEEMTGRRPIEEDHYKHWVVIFNL